MIRLAVISLRAGKGSELSWQRLLLRRSIGMNDLEVEDLLPLHLLCLLQISYSSTNSTLRRIFRDEHIYQNPVPAVLLVRF